MKEEDTRQIFEKFLERIVFKEEKLKSLKAMIRKVHDRTLPMKDLKNEILGMLSEMYDELRDLYPFFVKKVMKLKSSDDAALRELEAGLNKKLEEREAQLKEKDDLLQQAGVRLAKIEKELNIE